MLTNSSGFLIYPGYLYLFIYVYVCVYICMCVCVKLQLLAYASVFNVLCKTFSS